MVSPTSTDPGFDEPAQMHAQLEDVSDVRGPVLNKEGRRLHDEFDW
jgi:hypothetical protein